MARVGRLAGAILAETEGSYYLVGQTKVPCDWGRAGFEPPGEFGPAGNRPHADDSTPGQDRPHADDSTRCPYIRLARLASAAAIDLGPTWLTLSLEGEALARGLATKLLVERNGSVSERLWRLIVSGGVDSEDDDPPEGEIDARWLGEIPPAVWQIVRDTVLRCV
jgi:hypothetical protein